MKLGETQQFASPGEALEHHGVKGMHWGIRKDDRPSKSGVRKQEVKGGGHIRISEKTGGASVSTRNMAPLLAAAFIVPPLVPLAFLSPRFRREVKAARKQNMKVQKDKQWKKKVDSSAAGVRVHNLAAKEVNKKLPEFNSDKRWTGMTANSPMQKAYDDAVQKEILNPAYARAAVKVHGANSPNGRYKFEIKDSSTAELTLVDTYKDTEIDHAAIDDKLSVQFKIVRDDSGHILGYTPEDDDVMVHTDEVAEFLSHYGVKGMRWGVRKEEDTGTQDLARINVEAKRKLSRELSTDSSPGRVTVSTTAPVATTSKGPVQTKAQAKIKEPKAHHNLTPTQKKVLIGLGVTAGVAGVVAYSKYKGNPFILKDGVGFDPRTLAKQNISRRKVGNLAEGHHAYDLLDPHSLHVDVSKGYANITPIAGFANVHAEARHAAMIESLDEFRELYPSIRNMNLEVVPLSHQPGFGSAMASQNMYAAVMSMRPGEARIFYNDLLDDPPPGISKKVSDAMFPDIGKPGGLGDHEMGHLLAVAGGKQIPSFGVMTMPQETPGEAFKKQMGMINYSLTQNKLHKEAFKKHGLTYGELSKLSGYAATQPAESMAELSRYYHSKVPEVRAKLTPEQRVKAKALFEDLGGVHVDNLRRPEKAQAVA